MMQNSIAIPILLSLTISAYILQAWFVSWRQAKKSTERENAPRDEDRSAA